MNLAINLAMNLAMKKKESDFRRLLEMHKHEFGNEFGNEKRRK